MASTLSPPSGPGDFSKDNIPDFTDPSEIMLFPRSEADYQAFLISQMRLNDELAAEFSALVRRRFEVPLAPGFPSPS